MGNKAASLGGGPSESVPAATRNHVTPSQRQQSGQNFLGGSPSISNAASPTPNMNALVSSLIHSVERGARVKSERVILRQKQILKDVGKISGQCTNLRSKTLDAGNEAIQASQDIVHEIDLAKHHILHILEISEQIKSMLPPDAQFPESPFENKSD